MPQQRPHPLHRRNVGEHPRDPVILALMQNRLDQISKHMGWVMTRTARSPIFSQSHDFSCFVTDPAGTLDRQCRRHSDPHRWRRLCGAGAAAGFRRPYSSRGCVHPLGPLRRRRQSSARLGDRATDLRRARRAACRLLLQPGAPIGHRRRACRHLQSRGHRDLARRHPPARS